MAPTPMLFSPMRDSSLTSHPICVFVGTWSFVFLLYALHLSEQLIYHISDFYYVCLAITVPFLVAYWYVNRLLTLVARMPPSSAPGPSAQLATLEPHSAELIWRHTVRLLQIWGVITVIEIIFSGGLPIIWLITGSSKNYRDFGIPSLHGFLISILLACSMVSFWMFLETRQRRYIAVPVFALLWFAASITRGYMLGLLLQLLFFTLARKPLTTGQIVKIAVGFVCFIIAFGYLGDFRSGGGDLIRALGKPTERYPDWLPTGFLWAYIYLATPLNNLLNTLQLNPSIDQFTLAATTSQLLPSFVRNLIFPESLVTQGDLVDTSLNVSTSFAPPYLDMGLLGIVLYSLLFGSVAALFWHFRRERFYLLGYSFVAQALALSVFFSFLLALPYLFQLVWFRYLLRPGAARRPAPRRTATA